MIDLLLALQGSYISEGIIEDAPINLFDYGMNQSIFTS